MQFRSLLRRRGARRPIWVILCLISAVGAAIPAGAAAQTLDFLLLQDTAADDGSIIVAFRPSDASTAYSFWYPGTPGYDADWQAPAGWRLGETRFPPLRLTGDVADPRFRFDAEDYVLQRFIPDRPDTAPGTVGLTLTIGVCQPECVGERVVATANLNMAADSEQGISASDLLSRALPERRAGIMMRAGGGEFSVGVNRNRNDDGAVAHGWLLPFDARFFDGSGFAELAPYPTGFFSTFALDDYDPGEGRIDGILVLKKVGAEEIHAYSISEPNDYAQANMTSTADMTAERPAAAPENSGLSFLTAILFALVGGLILNVMPCVFPVLAMKAFAIVRAGSASGRELRRDGLAYTAGIVLSFLIVAGVLIAIRAAGTLAGWGFQLQSPVFVGAMAILLFVVGLNFLGLFEIPSRFAGIGQGLAAREGPAGSFFTGVLATVVATPCTAPFMAPAVAYALAQPAGLGLSVFFALGLGLALPYLVVSFIPAAQRLFPKPGSWMQTFRQFLAFPLFATVVWLVWIESRQTGSTGVLYLTGAMVAIALAFWLLRITGAARAFARATAVVLLIVSIVLPLQRLGGPGLDGLSEADGGAAQLETVVYSEEVLNAYRAEGRPVFLHFWAAWCIICLMHENLVFHTPEFVAFARERNMAFMVIDNTEPDPGVTALMESFGRSGQPLDIIYPGDPMAEPVVLPELFTFETVSRRIREILGSPGASAGQ